MRYKTPTVASRIVSQPRCGQSHDEIGLFELVVAAEVHDAGARRMRSVQRRFSLRLRFWLMTAEAASRIDLGRSVVLLELDRPDLREVVFEIKNVAKVGAAPFVNRLVRVADDARGCDDLPPDAGSAGSCGRLVS